MQSEIGMPRTSPWSIGRVARGAWTVLLIALGLGCSPIALAKETPNAVIDVTPAGGSTYADPLTIYGIVSAPTAADPVPTGTITFATREPPFNINTPLCSVTINVDNSVQSCDYGSAIPAGNHHFILIYSGDANYEGNDTGTLASEDYVISKQTPTFSLAAAPAPVFVGQYVALKFTFHNAFHTDGRFTASVENQASCSIYSDFDICAAGKMIVGGTFGISVSFDGDANHNAVPSTVVAGQVTVLPAPTTLKIEPHSAITLGDTADMVLTFSNIIDPDDTLFAGDITLSDGEVSCQIQKDGDETSVHCPFKPLSTGMRQLTATYGGFGPYASPATAYGTLEVVASEGDGACGSDNGLVLPATPTNLCSAGTPGAVIGSGHPWSWTCTGTGGGSNASCSATIRTWTVSAQTSGSGGSITPPSRSVDNGNAATFTIGADPGYVVDSVTGCGGSLAGNTYTTAAVNADCAVTATFAASSPGTYTVSAVASPAAFGSLACASPVNAGATSTCTAAPNGGYVTQSIGGCGGTVTASGVNSYTTGAVNANCTVTATFAAVAPPRESVLAPAPALGKWALAMLALLLAMAAGAIARRKQD